MSGGWGRCVILGGDRMEKPSAHERSTMTLEDARAAEVAAWQVMLDVRDPDDYDIWLAAVGRHTKAHAAMEKLEAAVLEAAVTGEALTPRLRGVPPLP